MKKIISVMVFILLLSTLFAAVVQSEDDQVPAYEDVTEECGFFCHVWKWLSGDKQLQSDDQQAVVGEAAAATKVEPTLQDSLKSGAIWVIGRKIQGFEKDAKDYNFYFDQAASNKQSDKAYIAIPKDQPQEINGEEIDRIKGITRMYPTVEQLNIRGRNLVSTYFTDQNVDPQPSAASTTTPPPAAGNTEAAPSPAAAAAPPPLTVQPLLEGKVYQKDGKNYLVAAANKIYEVINEKVIETTLKEDSLAGAIQKGEYTTANGWKPTTETEVMPGLNLQPGEKGYCVGGKCFDTEARAQGALEVINRPKTAGAPDSVAPPPSLDPQERKLALWWGISTAETDIAKMRAEINKRERAAGVAFETPLNQQLDANFAALLGISNGGTFTDPKSGKQVVVEKRGDQLIVTAVRDRPVSDDPDFKTATWNPPTKDSSGNRIEGYYINSETGDAWDINGETDWAHTRTFDQWSRERLGIATTVFGDKAMKFLSNVWKGIGSLGSWRGLSTKLAPDLTKDFVDFSDEYFGRKLQLGEHITKAYCEYDSRHSADIPGQSSLFIEGAGGTYQFVAALQAERSSGQTPILCNDDPEVKDEDRCPGDLVCKDQLCYDNEAAEKPEAGYFYKIIWGVTAPQDQAYTPYIDEDGVSVKFNIKFKGTSDWLYEREDGSADNEVVELNNGAKDQGVILDYSQKIHNEACIIFNEKYRPEDRSGDLIDREFCVTIKVAAPGAVEFETEDAEEKKPSATVSSGRVRGRSIFQRSSSS